MINRWARALYLIVRRSDKCGPLKPNPHTYHSMFFVLFFFFLNKTNDTSSIMEDDHLLENQVGVF
jgi:hypothetical protein